jgi:LacI family transcriptional regulator
MDHGGLDGRILRGILQHRFTTIPWLILDAGHANQALDSILKRPIDGWIGRFSDPGFLKQIESMGAPVVHLDAEEWVTHANGVWLDHRNIGAEMAAYYCDAAYATLMFASNSNHYEERERWRGFRDEARRRGRGSLWFRYDVGVMEDDSGHRHPRPETLKALMPTLPKPIGIGCANDNFALNFERTLEVSHQKIPDEIALIGVGNAPSMCDVGLPPLSSVDLPGERIGFEAAELLGRLMAGEPGPKEVRLVSPSGIVERQSSSCVALHDPLVAHAVSTMRQHLENPMSIQEIADQAGCTRKTLERRFQQVLDKSPGEQYRILRVDHARVLLKETDFQVKEVAHLCGYGKPDAFSKDFRHQTGVTPTRYRKENGPTFS